MKQPEVKAKDTLMLDRVLRKLKFFKRFDVETRAKIYQESQLISLPG